MARAAQEIIQEAGVTTVCSKIFLAGNPDYRAGADQAASLTPPLNADRGGGRAERVVDHDRVQAAALQPEGAAGRRDRLGGHRQPEARWDNG